MRAYDKKHGARQLSKLQTKQELEEDTISRWDYYDKPTEEYGYEIIENYNQGILYSFMHSLKAIAPELAWADSDPGSVYGGHWQYEPRGLQAIPHKFRKWTPQTEEDWGDLLERIIKERDMNRG
jgi:hypothetical protein